VPAELSFVLHTAAPGRPDAVLAEIAVGLGETLASGTQGAGWRLEADAAGKVRTLAFANLSTALLPGGGEGVRTATVDYSAQPLSGPPEARAALGARLGAVGRALQGALGGVAQDVEGGVVADGRLFVVQSRPQPM
jgi:phosphoglucan,water dikinase